MLATAKEETHIRPGLEFIPNSYQADLSFSGEIALELPDDNNGNLTQKTNKTTSAFTLYEYDAENKLIRVVREDGSIVNYKYDGLGRRIEKEVDSVVTQYIYDNEDILLELDGSNNIIARYTHGTGIDEPLIVEKGGASFFYHASGLDSIAELTDVNGSVVKSYTYSSFGKIESETNPTFFQPYTFTAREFDSETGLYFYRARNYDPHTGRFLQEDPIGFAGGDLNIYAYVTNNPTGAVDPFGLRQARPPRSQRPRPLLPNRPTVEGQALELTEKILDDLAKRRQSRSEWENRVLFIDEVNRRVNQSGTQFECDTWVTVCFHIRAPESTVRVFTSDVLVPGGFVCVQKLAPGRSGNCCGANPPR